MPDFLREYRALILNNTNYSYEKASAGSFRDFVPDHWHFGYLMATHARRKYGNEIWKKSLNDATHYRGLFYPLNNSLKKQTGLTTNGLYQEMVTDLKKTWKTDPKPHDRTR